MKGFDNEKYIKLQSKKIVERIALFDNKLYMEFGGKLFDDLHASRVLPGFEPESKVNMLREFKDKVEVILCINANDIEKKKIRADHGISYDIEVLRLIEKLKKMDLPTVAVVITQYKEQTEAIKFKKQLEGRGINAYFHTLTKGYPTDVDTIVSEEGYGAQPYIETTKPLIVVAAPGPSSGKLATCLSQLYHDYKRGIKAGFAKFETFPVWNLPLKHPVNIAYESSTADIGDVNMIDNFHLEQYGERAVNYNRDLAVFPILKNILNKIIGKDIYFSPTDMGINTVGLCIKNEKIVEENCNNEIIRRYLNSLCDYKNGLCDNSVPTRIKVLMDEIKITVADRKVVSVALETKEKKNSDIVAIQLKKNKIITGKNTNVMTASASAVINAIKIISNIEDKIHLIPPVKLNSLLKIKQEVYKENQLNLPDVLIALATSEAIDSTVGLALSNLKELKGLEAHSTVMLPKTEQDSLKKLGINITCTDEFSA